MPKIIDMQCVNGTYVEGKNVNAPKTVERKRQRQKLGKTIEPNEIYNNEMQDFVEGFKLVVGLLERI